MSRWRHVGPTLETCKAHGRPVVIAIAVPGVSRYTACDQAGCRRDAELGHRMEHGPGHLLTVRTSYAAGEDQ